MKRTKRLVAENMNYRLLGVCSICVHLVLGCGEMVVMIAHLHNYACLRVCLDVHITKKTVVEQYQSCDGPDGT